jgi:hypothetical protein
MEKIKLPELSEAEDLLKWQLAALAISAVTVLSTFSHEAAKNRGLVHQDNSHDMFRRESRESEIAHTQHIIAGRAKYATITGQ